MRFADHAQLRADLAAQEDERDDRDDGDEGEDESVFGETLASSSERTRSMTEADSRNANCDTVIHLLSLELSWRHGTFGGAACQ